MRDALSSGVGNQNGMDIVVKELIPGQKKNKSVSLNGKGKDLLREMQAAMESVAQLN